MGRHSPFTGKKLDYRALRKRLVKLKSESKRSSINSSKLAVRWSARGREEAYGHVLAILENFEDKTD